MTASIEVVVPVHNRWGLTDAFEEKCLVTSIEFKEEGKTVVFVNSRELAVENAGRPLR